MTSVLNAPRLAFERLQMQRQASLGADIQRGLARMHDIHSLRMLRCPCDAYTLIQRLRREIDRRDLETGIVRQLVDQHEEALGLNRRHIEETSCIQTHLCTSIEHQCELR